MWKGKKIIVGITGSIAAYKSAYLIRALVKEGAEVRVAMTPAATDFISSLTVGTLSKNSVGLDFKTANGEWNNHVEFALWADAFVVAPASANTLAKMANGITDNFFLTVYQSLRCPVFIAPAMDADMWLHPATQKNIHTLQSFGHTFIHPTEGELASGLTGVGRMAEPDDIVRTLADFFFLGSTLADKQVLVTAGPTYEAIDPVRFIGNHSSGKMGYAIAEALAHAGAQVQLVSGRTHLTVSHSNITLHRVTSAEEMLRACEPYFSTCSVAVFAAAVADYRPEKQVDEKIKKTSASLFIPLVATPDIALAFGKQKKAHQVSVGFALETNDEQNQAQQKLKKKNFTFIVLNSLRDAGAGFGTDTNVVTIIDEKESKKISLQSKAVIARELVHEISSRLPV